MDLGRRRHRGDPGAEVVLRLDRGDQQIDGLAAGLIRNMDAVGLRNILVDQGISGISVSSRDITYSCALTYVDGSMSIGHILTESTV